VGGKISRIQRHRRTPWSVFQTLRSVDMGDTTEDEGTLCNISPNLEDT